jgi:hypothetical protein
VDGATPSRFAMTPVPRPGGQAGAHEEQQAQWFLELSFFRDLVLRNPPGRGGRGELADAVVLHDDVVLMLQSKAQFSARPPQVWAKGAIEDALRQLGYTHRMLVDGHVTALRSELLGDLAFDPAKYKNRWGLIILDQAPDPFEPQTLVPELSSAGFPVQVYSLADFQMVTERFDTAADLINYMEMRDAFRGHISARVHEEPEALARVMAHAEDYFRAMRPDVGQELLDRTVAAIQRTGAGAFLENPLRAYGQAYDDIIARMHDVDPELPENRTTNPADVLPILEELGWLSRARRVALGRQIGEMCSAARDGGEHVLCHFQRPRGVVFVYLSCSLARSERAELVRGLVFRAQAKYDCEVGVGVATEPLGAGRSYDAFLHRGRLTPDLVQTLRTTDDPFGDDSSQLTA